MKKMLSYWTVSVIVVLLGVSTFSCGDKGAHYQKQVVLPAGETHEGWYFAAGDRVLIEGTINGDAYVAGGEVQVDGTINGDLLVAGGLVRVSGKVSDDVRAAGGTIVFDGSVGKNVSVAGGSVRVSKTSTIEGGLLAACGNLDVSGDVAKSAMVASGQMTVTGMVKGNVRFTGERLSVVQGATIGGDLNAFVKDTSGVEIADGSVIGKTDVKARAEKAAALILGYSPFRFWVKVLWILSLIATTLVLLLVCRKQLTGIGTTILQKPGISALWGVAGVILIPVAIGLLCITIIGIPLALFLLAVYLWLLYLSQLSLGVALGQRFFGGGTATTGRLFWAIALGIIIIHILTFIPYLRFFVMLAGLVFGVGALLLVIKDESQLRRAPPQST